MADKLGIPPDRVRFEFGDTDQVAIGTGTFGSRSMICGGTALLLAADKVIAKGKKLAAHMLEAAEHDIVFEDGKFVVSRHRQNGRPVRSCDQCFQPASTAPGHGARPLRDAARSMVASAPIPNGCHIVEVEIDEATGAFEIVRYHAVDDVGHMINPLLVEGQLHGGIAQGVGQALIENIVYQSGQIVTGSFMDYGMPRADISARSSWERTRCRPQPTRWASKVPASPAPSARCPAVMNAVNDALARIGAPYVQMPATSGEGLARGQGGARRRDCEAIGSDCIVWPGASSVAITRTKG